MKYHVDFDLSTFGEKEEDYQYLEEAIHKVTKNNKQHLDTMKQEKWFKRVFDMVTFSNKKSIRISEQISSIAQAQDILIEILKRLSNTDAKIDEMILNNTKNIESLYDYTEVLALKVKQLLNKVISGIDKELNINDLNNDEKIILSSLLQEAATTFNETSQDQKEFADKTLRYLGVPNSDAEVGKAVESIDSISTKKVILQILLEYGFLSNKDFVLNNEFEDLVDYFDFGNKTIKKIKEKIKEIYNLRGVEGFTWFTNFEEEYINYFDFELNNEEVIIEERDAISNYGVKNPKSLEEVIIKKEIEIPYGETLKYNNSHLIIKDKIIVKGELIITNSFIDMTEDFKSIEVEEGKVLIEQSSFMSPVLYNEEGYLGQEFKSLFNTFEANIKINKCMFDMGIPFNPSDYDSFISIKNTKFFNILGETTFIEGKSLLVEKSEFENHFITDQKRETNEGFDYYISMFTSEVIELKDNIFKDIYNISSSSNRISDNNSKYYNCKEIYNRASDSASIQKVLFENCESIFLSINNGILLNLNFSNCKDILTNVTNTEIKECVFNRTIYIVDVSHGLKFSECIFKDITFIEPNRISSLKQGFMDFSIFKKNEPSEISRCTFKNINLEDNYLVTTSIIEKPSKYFFISVVDNKFININSNNDDIIKLWDEYQQKLTRRWVTENVGIERDNIVE